MSTRTRKKTDQEQMLLIMLNKHKFLKTTDAAQALNLSECTIRRLFNTLEQQGEAVRVYGGIQLSANSSDEYKFEGLQMIQSEQKHRIGNDHSRSNRRSFGLEANVPQPRNLRRALDLLDSYLQLWKFHCRKRTRNRCV